MPDNKFNINTNLNKNLFIVEELRPKIIEKNKLRTVTASDAIRIAVEKLNALNDHDFHGAFSDKKDGKDNSKDGKDGKENTKEGKDGKEGKEGSDDKESCDTLFEYGIWEKYPSGAILKNKGTKVLNGSIKNVAEFMKPIL